MSTDIQRYGNMAVTVGVNRNYIFRYASLAVYAPLASATSIQRFGAVAVYAPGDPPVKRAPKIIFFM